MWLAISARRPPTALGRSGGPYRVTTQFYHCMHIVKDFNSYFQHNLRNFFDANIRSTPIVN